jgi:hypothetical protein
VRVERNSPTPTPPPDLSPHQISTETQARQQAGTQTLFESGEDFLTGDRLDATRVDIVDATLDLLFPLLTEIEAVQTSGDGFDQIRSLARWQLKGGFEDSVRLGHRGGF